MHMHRLNFPLIGPGGEVRCKPDFLCPPFLFVLLQELLPLLSLIFPQTQYEHEHMKVDFKPTRNHVSSRFKSYKVCAKILEEEA